MINRVQTGQPISKTLTANNWNQIADAVNAPHTTQQCTQPATKNIYCKNNGSSDFAMYEVIELGTPVFSPVLSSGVLSPSCEFARSIVINAILPTEESTKDKSYAITLEPIAAGRIGRISGLGEYVQAYVNVTDTNHAFAKVTASGTLESCEDTDETAVFKIVAKGDSTGNQYCVGFFSPINTGGEPAYLGSLDFSPVVYSCQTALTTTYMEDLTRTYTTDLVLSDYIVTTPSKNTYFALTPYAGNMVGNLMGTTLRDRYNGHIDCNVKLSVAVYGWLSTEDPALVPEHYLRDITLANVASHMIFAGGGEYYADEPYDYEAAFEQSCTQSIIQSPMPLVGYVMPYNSTIGYTISRIRAAQEFIRFSSGSTYFEAAGCTCTITFEGMGYKDILYIPST